MRLSESITVGSIYQGLYIVWRSHSVGWYLCLSLGHVLDMTQPPFGKPAALGSPPWEKVETLSVPSV